MKENKDQPGRVSTCFEESPCAEMIQKIMSERGIGSLCEEMMRALIESCREGKEESKESKKEEDHGPEE